VLSLVISILAIPIADSMVIERDRNRNEMYGEAFWIYGFGVYSMTDQELAEALPPEWDYNDGDHVLPGYLGNITYEYPVFGLVFFAIATWINSGLSSFDCTSIAERGPDEQSNAHSGLIGADQDLLRSGIPNDVPNRSQLINLVLLVISSNDNSFHFPWSQF